MGTWHEITGPLKRFAGASGTVASKKGWIILRVLVVSGTATNIPDGHGGVITLTGPVDVNNLHEGMVVTADASIVFSAAFYLEVMAKDGF